MINWSNIGSKTKDIGADVLDYLQRSPIEIFLVGAFGLGMGIYFSHHHEAAREKNLPLAYSDRMELVQTLNAKRGSGEIDQKIKLENIAEYLTTLNDTVMHVSEAWDNANLHPMGNVYRNFARELKRELAKKPDSYPNTLAEHLQRLPELSRAALNTLSAYVTARIKLEPVIGNLNRAWSLSTHEDTREDCGWENDCSDSDGDGDDECTSVWRCHTVCDHVHYTYTYDPIAGNNAQVALDILLKEVPQLHFPETFPKIVERPSEEMRDAADKSNATKACDDKISEDACYIKLANTWNTGASVNEIYPEADNRFGFLEGHAQKWNRARQTAHSESHESGCSSDSNIPREYALAEAILTNTRALTENLANLVQGIEYARVNADNLNSKINELIALSPGKDHEKEAKKLSKEILKLNKSIYQANFSAGVDMAGYRIGMVFLFGALGLLGGVALGYGADKLVDRIPSERRNEKQNIDSNYYHNYNSSYRSQFFNTVPERRFNRHR